MITVTASPTFELQLSLQDVEIMQRLAKHHYDSTCRLAGETGFIKRWQSGLLAQFEDEAVVLTASWYDLDILSKILESRFWESENDAARMSKISITIGEAMRIARAEVSGVRIPVVVPSW